MSPLLTSHDIDRAALEALASTEAESFRARTPKSIAMLDSARTVMPNAVPMAWMQGLYRHHPIFAAHGEGAGFHDIDGNFYTDFNLCDLSLTVGFAHPAIISAVVAQAGKGAQFLLPGEDAIHVSQQLAAMTGLPFWQYTLSASGANAEVIRLARLATGREKILMFDGKYHGHVDDTLVKCDGDATKAELLGLPKSLAAKAVIVPFNDAEALEKALANHDIALVLAEPALSNCSLVLPEPGFLEDMRRLTLAAGTLLCFDEAHTFQFAFGGLTRATGVTPDLITIGKGLGTGIPLGAYGMTPALAKLCEDKLDADVNIDRGLATGGTIYANPISLAAARAALDQVLTPEGFARIEALGARMADGIDRICRDLGLPWRAFRYGPRTGFCLAESWPTTAQEAFDTIDVELIDARRLYMANRGAWEAMAHAGPQVGFAHSEADIDLYLNLAEDFTRLVVA